MNMLAQPADVVDVVDEGVHEYGIRRLSRVTPSGTEYWLIRPDHTIALYTRWVGGRIAAAYRHKPGRIAA